MSTEPASAASDSSPGSFQRILIEALARGGGGRDTLKGILAHAPMAEEQRSLVDLLMSLDSETASAAATAAPIDAAGREDLDDEPSPAAPATKPLQQELADLREVNDTLAAALGACRVCWGGDAACPECGGRGRAGSLRPDPGLFRELVIPAVRRVRSQERNVRPASRRPRIDGSREWRHSHEW